MSARPEIPTPIADRLARLPGVVDLAMIRNVRLTERALGGDFEACVEWLTKHGGPMWSDAPPPPRGHNRDSRNT